MSKQRNSCEGFYMGVHIRLFVITLYCKSVVSSVLSARWQHHHKRVQQCTTLSVYTMQIY